MSAPNQYNDPTGRMAESTMRIKDLYQAEKVGSISNFSIMNQGLIYQCKKLVLLIETAAEALAILSDEAPKDENTDQFVRDRAMSFRDLASRYFSLVNVGELN